MSRTVLAGAALVAALATGCSTGDAAPAAADFAAGGCRAAASALLGLHATARRVLRAHHPDLDAAAAAVRRDQRSLLAARRAAGPADAAAFDRVVVAAGFFRIRVDSKTFEPWLARDLDAAYAAAAGRCVSARAR